MVHSSPVFTILFVCVLNVCMCMHEWTHACGGQRSTLSVLRCSLPCVLRQGLPLSLELTVGCPECPETSEELFLARPALGLHMHATILGADIESWGPNLDPCACTQAFCWLTCLPTPLWPRFKHGRALPTDSCFIVWLDLGGQYRTPEPVEKTKKWWAKDTDPN